MNKFAIGIPTINRADLLNEALEKYVKDFPDIMIYILDNGNQEINHKLSENIIVERSSENKGVAGSWNFLMKRIFKHHEYAFILNDDIYLGKNKNDIESLLENKYDFYVTEFNWCSYIIPKSTFELVGGFDEIFFPAYYEDNDYHQRMKMCNLSYFATNKLNPEIFRNSMTIEKDPSLNQEFETNKFKYIVKWGGLPGFETFKTPYNR